MVAMSLQSMKKTVSGTWLPHLMAASLLALLPVVLLVIGFSRILWPTRRSETALALNRFGPG
jgi:hypothetical protein